MIDADLLWRDPQRELSNGSPLENDHGINSQNVGDFLLEVPVLIRFKNFGGPNQPEYIAAWISLDESKESLRPPIARPLVNGIAAEKPTRRRRVSERLAYVGLVHPTAHTLTEWKNVSDRRSITT